MLSKSTYEIRENLEGEEGHSSARVEASFGSILTDRHPRRGFLAGLGDNRGRHIDESSLMFAAVTVAIVMMVVSAEAVSGFVNRHPTVKMISLSFLLLLGFTLLLDGFGQHVPKGYIYFAMGFSVFVEFLNLWIQCHRETQSHPIELHRRYSKEDRRDAEPTSPGVEDAPYTGIFWGSRMIGNLTICLYLLGPWQEKDRLHTSQGQDSLSPHRWRRLLG